MSERVIGIDIGAETVKVVELTRNGDEVIWTGRALAEHHKAPVDTLLSILGDWDWDKVDHATVTGRMSRQVTLPRIPIKQAQVAGFRHFFPDNPATVVSIGSHGFSVLELRESQTEVFRENSRCSQGTGNFLRQLVERFELTIEQASKMSATVKEPAPLSGRCPVILKTDMTHLANKGEPRERILAGLYDAVCENVQVLIKPRVSPARVALIGGVTRSVRIRENFKKFLSRNKMEFISLGEDEALYMEALGAARIALKQREAIPKLEVLRAPDEEHTLERLPPLGDYQGKIKRLTAPAVDVRPEQKRKLIVGYDIGSTGSKAVALDMESKSAVWEGYVNTNGAPVKAAQELTKQFAESDIADWPVLAVGATGSGREIVGSLMTTCFGPGSVFILNEIAAHAEGAMHFDSRVDTIFEIGGQDAKYIRLSGGRVVDAAMNEACSAGTGSFIEEQGKKFQGIKNVVQLGKEATKADYGVSLGQHCSVFMAEIIDEAVASGVGNRSIIAGIYDSIIQNYLNRVKGSRSVGQVIFCQGMPFSADALAASVVRQTGSEVIIPPNPGTVGALGISLLTLKELDLAAMPEMDLRRFLAAEVLKKDVFICRSKKGCGGAGNKCRIDRITTVVDNEKQKFTWGGGCSMYDKATGKKKLPDRSPDPFRERDRLVAEMYASFAEPRGSKRVAVTDEFVLKGMIPFFATFIYELGFDMDYYGGADQSVLKRGIEDANVPFCAPMQQYHGLVAKMAEDEPDYLFLPMMRNIPKVGDEEASKLCPIVQGSADMLKWDLNLTGSTKIISPVINFGPENLRSKLFFESCEGLAKELGAAGSKLEAAFNKAIAAQEKFDRDCLELGRSALSYCEEQGITPVVVLGRSYTIYNTVLNSNVPSILREQGVLPIPVDCYPVDDDIPIFQNMFWGYSHRNLRAAEQIRRTPGVYSLFCSNYSCGPDSFTIHFYSYIMEGKPFAIIETDGHSGDAGTKTRAEAFLYCVHEDLNNGIAQPEQEVSFKQIEGEFDLLPDIRKRDAIILIPRMGPGANVLAACLRGIGARAEALPIPDNEVLELGRRYTSGKECIPMTVLLGSMLQRIQKSKDENETFSFFLPTASGPCRFGCYHTMQKIVVERAGLKGKVGFWSPADTDYFEGMDPGFSALALSGFLACDMLLAAMYDTRPTETRPGAAKEIFEFYKGEVEKLLEKVASGPLSAGNTVGQVVSGHMFGLVPILKRAAKAYMAVKGQEELPTVLVVGEIFVRSEPFSNNYVIQKLEERNIRCRFAPFTEWLEYTDYQDVIKETVSDYVTSFMQATMYNQAYNVVAKEMGWPARTTVQDALGVAEPYIRQNLSGEAILTVGGPLHEWREGNIHGVLSVGPLECMPNKIAEAQFYHVAEKEGLISLTLALNGDPVDPEILDNFAYEVQMEFERRQNGKWHSVHPGPQEPKRPSWIPSTKYNPIV
jgi:predicted CoA-substrate-specific enzyme activase